MKKTILTKNHIEYLMTALDIMLDDLKEDIITIAKDQNNRETTSLWEILPPLGKASLDIILALKLLTTQLNIIQKFYTRKQIVLGNTAEEIMFYNAIEMAKELADQEMIDMELFDTYTAYTFQDMDFLFLYEYKYDGIETTEIGEQLGITSLAVSDWFKSFNNAKRKSHPVFWDKEERRKTFNQ
jgi:hypothetical protein